ncbi:MAG: FRG domain-containing protein [Burkholderiales bacterium]|nr:FRG domain-containing protein [Burkholderiales bacterium]
MEDITLKSVDDFPSQLKALRAAFTSLDQEWMSPLLFRGQGNSRWSLSTTLERYTPQSFTVQEYFNVIYGIRHKIETFTGTTWELNHESALKWASEMPRGIIPGYEYMTFLRHHGFPSPLLDWTESPQIALFFAFRESHPESQFVSVYVFCDDLGKGKISSSNTPSISSYGPSIKSHARHFTQKSNYTICTQFIEKDEEIKHHFVPHEEAVNFSDQSKLDQDFLYKINIPTRDRTKTLKTLSEYNLNAFSLFGSTEALTETLADEFIRQAKVIRA